MYLWKYSKVVETASNLMHEWALKLFYAIEWLIALSVKNDKGSILTSWIYIMPYFILSKKWKAHLFSYDLPSEFWHLLLFFNQAKKIAIETQPTIFIVFQNF